MGEKPTVQSVDRALMLLEVLARSDAPMGVGEVAELTGLPPGTAHRLLHTLLMRGYVRHDASRKYSVGTAALRLGDAAQRSLARSARSYLADLVSFSGETANLAVLEGDDVVYVAQVPSPHTQGWAVDEEEQELGVRCVAAPVGRGEQVVAAISLSGPAERFEGSRMPGLVDAMRRVAQSFADVLIGARE